MKNKVVCYHPTLENITFNDLITDLEFMLNDTKQFEDIVYFLLKDSMNEEDLASLFNFSVSSRLKWIISILKHLL